MNIIADNGRFRYVFKPRELTEEVVKHIKEVIPHTIQVYMDSSCNYQILNKVAFNGLKKAHDSENAYEFYHAYRSLTPELKKQVPSKLKDKYLTEK